MCAKNGFELNDILSKDAFLKEGEYGALREVPIFYFHYK